MGSLSSSSQAVKYQQQTSNVFQSEKAVLSYRVTTFCVIIINIALQTFIPTDVLRLPHPSSRHLDQLQKYRGIDNLSFIHLMSQSEIINHHPLKCSLRQAIASYDIWFRLPCTAQS